jgi:hypothetical protein
MTAQLPVNRLQPFSVQYSIKLQATRLTHLLCEPCDMLIGWRSPSRVAGNQTMPVNCCQCHGNGYKVLGDHLDLQQYCYSLDLFRYSYCYSPQLDGRNTTTWPGLSKESTRSLLQLKRGTDVSLIRSIRTIGQFDQSALTNFAQDVFLSI